MWQSPARIQIDTNPASDLKRSQPGDSWQTELLRDKTPESVLVHDDEGTSIVCGISGYVGRPDRTVLQRMARTLNHRGPDDAGILIDQSVGLAHRRLSIVGLDDGAQPLVDSSSELCLVFNGEIYSHPQLRAELERRGHRYQTSTDSESILHAYREWGVDCLSRFEGMFSFVLYDRVKNQLFGARDRLGQKPFYYTDQAFDDVAFAFASEVKALLQLPGTGRVAKIA